MATAFETVSNAAKTLTGAKEEATATLGAVAQAALALTGLANASSGAHSESQWEWDYRRRRTSSLNACSTRAPWQGSLA